MYQNICTHHKPHNNNENKITVFPDVMQQVTEYDVTNIWSTEPQKIMITMGKIDTSDLMMIYHP